VELFAYRYRSFFRVKAKFIKQWGLQKGHDLGPKEVNQAKRQFSALSLQDLQDSYIPCFVSAPLLQKI
jgi:hypothetical protein